MPSEAPLMQSKQNAEWFSPYAEESKRRMRFPLRRVNKTQMRFPNAEKTKFRMRFPWFRVNKTLNEVPLMQSKQILMKLPLFRVNKKPNDALLMQSKQNAKLSSPFEWGSSYIRRANKTPNEVPLMQSKRWACRVPRTLHQGGMKFLLCWVNAEWLDIDHCTKPMGNKCIALIRL